MKVNWIAFIYTTIIFAVVLILAALFKGGADMAILTMLAIILYEQMRDKK